MRILTEILLPVTAGFLLLISLFSALAVYSLRDFSRSRLEKFSVPRDAKIASA